MPGFPPSRLPPGEAAYRLVRDHHDQPYLGMTAHRFAEAVEADAHVDAGLLETVAPVDGVPALLGTHAPWVSPAPRTGRQAPKPPTREEPWATGTRTS